MANENIQQEVEEILAAKQHGDTADQNPPQETVRHTEQVYTDTPILFRASQMQQTDTATRKLHQLQRMSNDFQHSVEYIFYQQAKFMETFTDHYSKYVRFYAYYPTYRDMSFSQLRCYFTWRTQIRRGEYVNIGFSYAYVYLFELFHLIGVPDAMAGYEAIRTFCRQFAPGNPGFLQNVNRWLYDFVIYYGLDPALLPLDWTAHSPEKQQAQAALRFRASSMSAEQLLQHMNTLSPVPLSQLDAYQAHPAAFTRTFYQFYHLLAQYFQQHRKMSLEEHLFGNEAEYPYVIFPNAIFYAQLLPNDRTYSTRDGQIYRCVNGIWYKRYLPARNKTAGQLASFFQATDTALRAVFDMPSPEQPPKALPKYQQALLQRAVDQLPKPKPALTFDLSQLAEIRRAADDTRNKLLTEEERMERIDSPELQASPSETPETILAPISPPVPLSDSSPSAPDTDTTAGWTALSETEQAFLRCLLTNTSYETLLRQTHTMPSLLADHINAVLWDDFGDTVIAFDGDTPTLVEDYLDDLKGMMPL